MLDIKLIRKEREKIEAKLKNKEPTIDLSSIVNLDEKIRDLKTEDEQLKAKRNELSKKVGDLKKEGKSAEETMQEVRQIGEKIAFLDGELKKLELQFYDEMARVPNLPMDDVKISQKAEDNVCIKLHGDKPSFSFSQKNHVELNEQLKIFDFHRSAKTTGTGWPAYRGMGAKLEWALLNYMIEVQIRNGFEFWMPPHVVRPPIMFGSGQIPKFDGQYYQIMDKENPLYLIPTAEVVLNGLHYDEIIPEEYLPIRYAAYTPCFRREAGAAGSQERGLIRMHQFNKVEMFCFTKPEKSNEMMEEMIAVAEEILQGLQLHYRLCQLVTGDMSFTAAKTIDVEVWLPGQNRYYEVSSISNCTDYQARRSQIRYKGKTGKSEYVHTLNGSGLATSRLLVALLENNQNPDGTVHLPPILQEKLGVKTLSISENLRW
jgi:seryl-tRNA synthetase